MTKAFEAIADDLKSIGVDAVFGICSEEILLLAAAIDARGIRYITTRHENAAVIAAASFAGASGKVGCAMIGRGPALANALHGITSADRTGHPVLLLVGHPSDNANRHNLGGDHKEFESIRVLEAAGIATFFPSRSGAVPIEFDRAVAHAATGRVAALMLSSAVQNGDVPETPTRKAQWPEPTPRVSPRKNAIYAAALLLQNCKRPVILAGKGVSDSGAREAVEALAKKCGALLSNTLKGKDLFRGSPYNMGIIGTSSHACARRYMDQADCVIAVGASLNRFTMASGNALPDVPLIHIDIQREHVGKYWYADVGIVGDAKLACEQLAAALPDKNDKPFRSREIENEIAAYSIANDFTPTQVHRRIDPRTLAMTLDGVVPEDRHIVFDGGNHMLTWAYISTQSPKHFTHTLDFGSIGLGLGAAIGVAAARPESWTIVFIGDGGLLMSLGELETIIRSQLNVIVVVMNDAAFGAEVHLMRAYGQSPAVVTFFDVDFAGVAAPMGYEVATIESTADITKNIDLLKAPTGPILLDCKIDGEVAGPWTSEFLPAEFASK
jgi:acetolactate synthase-1/2/3 large subunit